MLRDVDGDASGAGGPLTVFRTVRTFLAEAPELRPWSLTFRDQLLERR